MRCIYYWTCAKGVFPSLLWVCISLQTSLCFSVMTIFLYTSQKYLLNMATGTVKIGAGIKKFSKQKERPWECLILKKVLKGFTDVGKWCSSMNNDFLVLLLVALEAQSVDVLDLFFLRVDWLRSFVSAPHFKRHYKCKGDNCSHHTLLPQTKSSLFCWEMWWQFRIIIHQCRKLPSKGE